MKHDLKNRIEILTRKAKVENIDISFEALQFIAHLYIKEERELEGALLRVVSYSVLMNQDIDVELAANALKSYNLKSSRKKGMITEIPKQISIMSRGAAVAAVCGVLMLSGCSMNDAANKSVVASAPVAAAAEQSVGQDVSLNGRAEPFQEVSISTPATGNLRALLVHLGDYVQQGEKLADIDGGDLAYRIGQAQAQVKKSQLEAQMKTIQQQLGQTQKVATDASGNNVESAKAKVKELEFALDQAQKNWERLKNGPVQPPEIGQALKAKDELEKQLNQAKQNEQQLSDKLQNQTDLIQQQMQRQQMLQSSNINITIDPNLVASVQAAKSQVTQLENAFAEAQKNLDSVKNSLDQKASLDQELAQAAAAKEQAENQLNIAKQTVDALMAKDDKDKLSEEQTSQLQSQLDQASASLAAMGVQQAKAELDLLQYQSQSLDLIAPISGFITEPKTTSGSGGGTTGNSGNSGNSSKNSSLFVITNLDQVYVKIDAPEAIVGKLKLDQKATVTFPAIGKTLEGKVTYIGQMADLETMTYPVRVLIDNKDHLIRGGMRAQVTLN